MNPELAKQAGLCLDQREPIECGHECISNCRREGCNCACGFSHLDEEERNQPEYIGTSKQWNVYRILIAKAKE